MTFRLLLVALLGIASMAGAADQSIHERFDQVLRSSVTDGEVDYTRIANNPNFAAYIKDLEAEPTFNSHSEALVYWINAYNALAIKGILDGRSPRTLLGKYSYFKKAKYRVGGKRINLYDLERKVISFTCLAGGFRHRFSSSDWRLRLISILYNYRCTRTRVISGAQAMFVRCTLFHQLGGFPNQPILEDIAFCHKLNTVTDPIILDDYVLTDARKLVKMGIWRSLARVLSIFIRLELGKPVATTHPFFQDVR